MNKLSNKISQYASSALKSIIKLSYPQAAFIRNLNVIRKYYKENFPHESSSYAIISSHAPELLNCFDVHENSNDSFLGSLNSFVIYVAENPCHQYILDQSNHLDRYFAYLYQCIWGSLITFNNVPIEVSANDISLDELISKATLYKNKEAFYKHLILVSKISDIHFNNINCIRGDTELSRDLNVDNFKSIIKTPENLFYDEAHVSKYIKLFDVDFYTKMYPEVIDSGVEPIIHYINWGAFENRWANSWLDPNFYKKTYSDGSTIDDPLAHYVLNAEINSIKTNPDRLIDFPDIIDKDIESIVFENNDEVFLQFEKKQGIASSVKLIAFYLPQFHPFEENDLWWGKGFTEWSNVTKAKPNFDGHYQPHLPIHFGFYDLRIPEVMIEQAKVAKNYGIYGFNFYYYWFDGTVLMNKPLDILLNNKDIDINFCLTWANENWTRRWDGAENDILIKQNHCIEDSVKFIHSLFKFFNDERYIRVENKPLLIVYRSNIIPNMKDTVDLWRKTAVDNGYEGLYIVGAQTFGFKNPADYGFDASMEFPPHTVVSNTIENTVTNLSTDFDGNIFDYNQVVKNACGSKPESYKLLKTVMLSWDNTARKQNNSHIFKNFSISKFKQWLSYVLSSTSNDCKLKSSEKFAFVNAWNEWAEGTHLEPDRKYGFSYLNAAYNVVKNFDESYGFSNLCQTPQRKNRYAVILHLHYVEMWPAIKSKIKLLSAYGFDLYVSLTHAEANIMQDIRNEFHPANIYFFENRGRDILPFIRIYSAIKNLGYLAICKIHSKKSLYRDDGAEIFDHLTESLLSSASLNLITKSLDNESDCGLFVPKDYLIQHTSKNMKFDMPIVSALACFLNIDFTFSDFPAGSMYWFRPEALNGIDMIKPCDFNLELGLNDGTLPHAIERIISILVRSNGYKVLPV